MKKVILGILTVFTCLMFAGCKKGPEYENLDPNHGIANQESLYGTCYQLNVRLQDDDYDPEIDAILMKNLGVKSMRFWLHSSMFLASPSKISSDYCQKAHKAISEFQKVGIEIIAVNHTNFNTGVGNGTKPARDLTDGSYYIKWLEDFELTYYTLANEFKEIKYWEIENETNGDFCNDMNGNNTYSYEMKAAITVDMLYYASCGIHRANSEALTVIGGPVGLTNGRIKSFYELIYQNIKSKEFGYHYGSENKKNASTNPDDYFQIACWHPYCEQTAFYKKVFKKYNDEIYQVILDNEGKHKKVIFSEIGWTNKYCTEEIAAKYLTSMFEVVKEEMPYVEFVTYFYLFDYGDAKTYWTGEVSRYGLFYDPVESRKYNNGITQDYVENGAPKLQGYAFQKAAGGEGEINIKKITK